MRRLIPSIVSALFFTTVLLGITADLSVASPLDVWTWSIPSTSNQQFNGIAYGNGLYVAVGDNSTIATSSDGITWTTKTYSNINANLRSVTYGNEMFIAVGYPSGAGSGGASTIITSTDGMNWQGRSSGTTNSLSGVAFGNGKFVVVSSNWWDKVLTSADGITWEQAGSGGYYYLQSISYANGKFVAVSNNQVLISSDGTTWQAKSTGSSYPSAAIYGSGRYVAVGGTSILTSVDGTTWENKAPTSLTNSLYGVTWGNNLFVAVGDSGKLYTSADGLTWTSKASGTTNTLRYVLYSNNLFVAIGSNGLIVTSSDGSTWTNRTDTSNQYVNAIAYGNGTFVTGGGNGKIYTSSEGVVWTSRDSGTTQSFNSIVYGNGRFVAVGGCSSFTSADGVTWKGGSGSVYCINSVSYGTGTFVGISGASIYTSTDGITWTSRISGLTNGSLSSIVYGKGKFVAVGSISGQNTTPLIITSSNGSTWTTQTVTLDTTVSVSLNSIAYGNGRFVTAGSNSIILSSSDGISWSQESAGSTSTSFNSVIFGNGMFVAMGSYMGGNNEIYVSKDGSSWTKKTIGISLSKLQYGNGIFVGASGNATLQSSMPLAPPTNFCVTLEGSTVNLSWSANKEAGIKGYKVYWGTGGEHPYANVKDVGNVTTYSVTDIPDGSYVTVTTYNDAYSSTKDDQGTLVNENQTDGNESWFAEGYVIERTAPSNPLVKINSYTSTSDIIMTLSAQDSGGITAYYASETSTTPAPDASGWISIGRSIDLAADFSFKLGSGDGSKTVYVWFKDGVGNISPASNATVTFDISWASPLDIWTWAMPSTSIQQFNGIAYGNNLYVAVGDNGTIATSADGSTWKTKSYTNINSNLKGIIYGNGMFVVVGDTNGVGIVVTSADGINWYRRYVGTTSSRGLSGVAYGGGKFVAVSSNSWDKVLTSTDGVAWETQPAGGGSYNFNGISYGNGKFLSISSSQILISADGKTWEAKSTGTYSYLQGIAYGNGKYVAVGGSSILASTDGSTWENKTPAGLTSTLNGVTWGNNTFIAVGDSGKLYTSSDGITWSSKSSSTTNTLRSVFYGNSLFVAIGSIGTIVTSPDGSTWTNRTDAFSQLNAIAYGNGTFVTGGSSGKVNTSSDGLVWTSRDTGATQNFNSIVYGNGRFIAVSDCSSRFTSTDGITWKSAGGGYYCINSVSYGNGIFVGISGSSIYTSADGVTWTSRSSGITNGSLNSVAYGKGEFVAVGSLYGQSTTPLVLTSADGITWTTQTVTVDISNASLQSIANGNGRFVALGANGIVLSSPDGIAWTQESIGGLGYQQISSVAFGNGMFVASVSNDIYISKDGSSWTKKTIGTSLYRLQYGDGIFIGTSSYGSGALLQSRMPLVPPADFRVTLDGGMVNLSWTANKEAGIKGYKVYWDTDGENPYANVKDVGNVTTYSATDITDGAYVTVTAYNDAYASTKDDQATVVNENQMDGNESWFAEGYVIERTAPTNAVVTIKSGSYTNTPNITLTLSAQDAGGVAFYYASESATPPARDASGWISVGKSTSFSGDFPFALSSGDGSKTVYVWFKDGVGNISAAAASAKITLDSASPAPATGSIVINKGSLTTAGRNVTVSLSAADTNGINGYFLSEISTVPTSSSNWTSITPATSYSSDISYTLSAGDGLKMVYAWFKDVAGNISPSVSATITLDLSATSPLDVWTWAMPATSTQTFNGITYGNNLYVAVGDNSTIATSTDGTTWNTKTYANINANLRSIAYGNGTFVAVGYPSGTGGVANIITSTDGIKWHGREIGTTNSLSGVAYGNGKFVAVSSNGWDKVLTSVDGVVWEIKSSGITNSFRYITYSSGRFIGVSDSQFLASSDGITWEAKSTGISYPSFQGIAYGNGKYAAVGTNSSNAILTSADGITWENKTPTGFTTGLYNVTWGNNLFVAVGDSGKLYTSADGLTWSSTPSSTTYNMKSVLYGNNLFVAIGSNGTIVTSSDGSTWTKRADASKSINIIAYGDGMFVAGEVSGHINTSTNGLVWTSRDSGTTQSLNSIVYGNGRFVATGDCSSRFISTDGINWKNTGVGYYCINSSIHGNGTFVGVSGPSIYTSPDGISWTSRSSGITNGMLSSVAFGNGKFVVVGYIYGQNSTPLIITSPDGSTWTKQTVTLDTTASISLNSIAYGNGKFVTVGSNNTILSSIDGIVWKQENVSSGSPSTSFSFITFGNGMFVAMSSYMGSSNEIYVSKDGSTWTKKIIGISLSRLQYGNAIFVGTSSSGSGALFQSRMPLAPPANFTVTLDGTTVNLSWFANTEAGIKGYKVYWDADGEHPYANVIDVPGSAVTTYSTTAIPDGAYVTITAYDEGYSASKDDVTTVVNENQTDGNESWFAEGYLVERTAPTNPAVSIESGTYTNTPNITLSLSAQDTGGIASYYVSENDTAPTRDASNWTAVGKSTSFFGDFPFTLSSGDGSKTVYVWFKDGVGNISQAASSTITLDSAGTIGSASINGGSAKTSKRDVILSFSATDNNGINGYYVSESSPAPTSSSNWINITSATIYASNINYTLSAGDGLKTVYTWFRDVAGNISSAVSATITLDLSATSPLDVWTWSMPSTSHQQFNGIAYGNGLYVAVGDNSTIAISSDGIAWTTKTYSNINANLRGITYGNGIFVAVGYPSGAGGGSTTITSTDGVNWHGRNSGTTNSLSGVAFGGGKFVAVSSNSWDKVLTSTDSITWDMQSLGIGSYNFQSINYSNGKFLAMSNSQLLISSDGTTWEAKSTGTSFYLQGISYGDGRYVAVGGGMVASVILTSTDGTVWENKPPTGLTSAVYGVTWGNSTFVAVGESGKIYTSADGLTWTSTSSGTNNALRSVLFGNNLFVAIGANGTIVTSPDASTWTNRTDASYPYMNAIAYGNGTFVAGGGIGKVNTSSDGLIWTSHDSGATQSFNSIVYGNGRFIAVGDCSSRFTSTDGISWKISGGGYYCINSLSYGNRIFVGVSGTNLYISTDGVTWTSQSSGITNGYLSSVTYGKGKFVAVGSDKAATINPVLVTSVDGIRWATQNVALDITGVFLNSIAYGNGSFVIVGERGIILRSSDGTNWTQVSAGSGTASFSFNSVTFGNGMFVVMGGYGNSDIYVSKDGSSWIKKTIGVSLNKVQYGNGIFVGTSGSGSGALLQSHMPLAPPANVIAKADATGTTISWAANTEAAVEGYKVYYGTEAEHPYSHGVDIGKKTSYTFSSAEILPGTNIAVTAYDADAKGVNDIFAGHESWYAPAEILDRIFINAQPMSNYSQYELSLIGEYDGGQYDLGGLWTSSDTSIATIPAEGNVLTAIKSGWVNVSTTYDGVTYKKTIPVYTTTAKTEGSSTDNNDKSKATQIASGEFYRGTLPQTDVDWFKFSLTTPAIIDFAYLSDVTASVSLYRTLDSGADILMASGTSANGQLNLSLGLSQGNYYLKLTTTAGDASKTYVLTYKVTDDLQVKIPIQLSLNEQKTSTINNLTDASEFYFSLSEQKTIRLLFTPQSWVAGYHLALLDMNEKTINRIDCKNQSPVSLEGNYSEGSYTFRVTAATDVDAGNPFTVQLLENSRQLEAESNNESEQATVFDIAKSMTGQLMEDIDVDFYTFTLDTPRYLSLTITALESTGNFSIKLYKESKENEIDAFNATAGQNTIVHMGLSAGRYYLKVSGGTPVIDTTHYYTLAFSTSDQTNLEIESNNTIKFANAIEKNGVKKGRIYSTTDYDYYGFHLSEAADIDISFARSSLSAEYKVCVVDETFIDDATTPCEVITFGQGISPDYKYLAGMPGNYYIRIWGSANMIDPFKTYELSIDSDAGITGLKQMVGVIVSDAKTQMTAGESQSLTARAVYSDASTENISPIWSSLNPAIATIDAAGQITAVAEGGTSIVAASGGLMGKFDLTIGAPQNVVKQHYGNLIVVAGGGIAATNTLKDSTQYLADLVYRRFKARLFNDDDIYYFNPATEHDLDGDGYFDKIVDDSSPTVADFGQAITDWAARQSTDGPLYVYLIDHGGIDNFMIFPDEIVTADQLKGYLDAFQIETGRKVVVMIEACKSGSFTDNLVTTDQDRIVVTSADNQNSYVDLSGRISFTQFFVDRLLTGDSLYQGYLKAKNQLAGMIPPFSSMKPQLEEGVSLSSARTMLGGDFAIASLFPEITETSSNMNVTANTTQNFYARLSSLEGIEAVWAVVTPPDYTPPALTDDLTAPQVTLPTFILTDPDKDRKFEGSYNAFSLNGDYKITFYARNENGGVSASAQKAVTVSGGTSITYDIAATQGNNGTIACNPMTVDHGSNSSCTITPNAGYHVIDVLADGVSVGAVTSYDFNNVTTDHIITATFAIDTYAITSAAGENGTITASVTVNYGSESVFTITPATGYHVLDVLVDGNSVGPVPTYAFANVNASHTIIANFALNTYSITATAGDNGSITCTPSVVNHGSNSSCAVQAKDGHHVTNVLADGLSIGAIMNYDFNNVTMNHTIAVSVAIDTYTITSAAGGNGTITPSVTANYGTQSIFTITPATGYHVLDVLVDGNSVGPVTTYTFTNVNAVHSISANFAINTYAITSASGGNGTITPSVTVNYGSESIFTITPATGYHVLDVLVDGNSVGPLTTYTFAKVNAGHTIAANFAINTYTITVTAGANGSITCTPSVVNHGSNSSCAVEANGGYHISGITVDGNAVTIESSYEFTNVTANHTIGASFIADPNTLKGDVNQNGTVDMVDAIVTLQIISGQAQGTSFHKGADANGDGRISLQDLVFIMQKVAEMR